MTTKEASEKRPYYRREAKLAMIDAIQKQCASMAISPLPKWVKEGSYQDAVYFKELAGAVNRIKTASHRGSGRQLAETLERLAVLANLLKTGWQENDNGAIGAIATEKTRFSLQYPRSK